MVEGVQQGPVLVGTFLNLEPRNLLLRLLQMSAGTSKMVRQGQIMAWATVLAWRFTPCLSFFSFFLDFLPGTATIYPLCRSTAEMTQSYFSLSTAFSGMANTSMAMERVGASGIAVNSGFPAVECFRLMVALHTAQSLQ